MKLHVIFNGTGAAFYRQVGCPCPRCTPPILPPDATAADHAALLRWHQQAHTSVSLVLEENGVAIDHTLVDCGMNVPANLATLSTPATKLPIDRILITHGHLDHIIGLDMLINGLKNARKTGDFALDRQPWPIPLYTTLSTWQRTIGKNPVQPEKSGHLQHIEKYLDLQDLTEDARLLRSIDLHPALNIIAVPVEHYLHSLNFRCTFWPSGKRGDGTPIQFALCWDVMTYPGNQEGEAWRGISLPPEGETMRALFSDLDLLAIEMTMWHPHPNGHIGFAGAMRKENDASTFGVRDYVHIWQPRMTRLVHYSGASDRQIGDGTLLHGEQVYTNRDPRLGPVRDADLTAAVRQELPDYHGDIAPAWAGEVITFGA